MDVLTRVRELLGGKKSQKRKQSITEEYEKLELNKKSRMSELNGDSDVEFDLFNTGNNYDSRASLKNHSRQSDSYLHKSSGSRFLSSGAYNQTNQRNDNSSHYNFNNGAESQYSQFKQPMPPKLTNGSSASSTRKVPGLIVATKNAFERTMFNRGLSQPQQTVTPFYNRYGERSELANFKKLPELYPIRQNASNANSLYFSGDNSVNGQEHSALLTPRCRFGNSMNQQYERPLFSSSSNTLSATPINRPIFNSSVNNQSSSSMSLRANSFFPTSGQRNPPLNLSRNRYQEMLNMIPGMKLLKKYKTPATNESSLQGIIDLSEESDARGTNTSSASSSVPTIERVNSLKARLDTKDILKDDWEQRINEKYSAKSVSRRDSLRQLNEENHECEEKTRETEDRLKESFNKITISSIVPEDEEEEVPVNDFPPMDQEKHKRVNQLIHGRDTGTVLINKFNLQITRHDIQTLQWNPLTWLNDEVINFYMELLAERSRQNEKLPKVHGMNTFFLKRLMETGYSGVRRWTRKVDIFAHDIVPIPVHKGIHWCMAIIHLKNKTIKYYDSMGAPNNPVLKALADYLQQESLDKKKVAFDMNGWSVENVKNIPQQENGSDCGVFSCMYAEFITRNRPIVFAQKDMPYFRMKMIYEICTGQMLN